METNKVEKVRESGIELLKVIAIIFVVLHHVTQTAIKSVPALPVYGLNSTLLKLIELLGPLGNLLFIICSFWFLVDSTKVKVGKIVTIMLQSITISLVWLGVLLLAGEKFDFFTIFKQFLPEIFQNLWFISVYLIFYIIHPLINFLFGKLRKHAQFMAIGGCFALYFILEFFLKNVTNYAMIFVITYLVIYYLKNHCREDCDKLNLNILFAMVGLLGLLGITLVKTFIFVSWEPDDSYRYLYCYQYVFALLFGLSLFHIFRSFKFKSNIINTLSSCSLLVYAIHENCLFRGTLRKRFFDYIYNNFGLQNFIWWILLVFVVLLLSSFIIALLFKKTAQIPIDYVSKQSEKLSKNLVEKLLKRNKTNENR